MPSGKSIDEKDATFAKVHVGSTKGRIVKDHLRKLLQKSEISPKLILEKLRKNSCSTNAKWVVKYSYWTVIYLAGIVLTMKGCIEVCKEHIADRTTLNITNTTNQILMPNFTICVQFDPTVLYNQTTPFDSCTRSSLKCEAGGSSVYFGHDVMHLIDARESNSLNFLT